MSAMSASSGLMPLSLISEHKSAQGGSATVQPLAFAPEKLPIVQPAKPTPNGMEPSPLVPVIPTQPDSHPSLTCGGAVESGGMEDKSGIIGGGLPENDIIEATPFVPMSAAGQITPTESASTVTPVVNTPTSNVPLSPSIPPPSAAHDSSLPTVSDSPALPLPQSQPAPNASLPEPAATVQSHEKAPAQQDVPSTCESLSTPANESSNKPDKEESNTEKVSNEPQNTGEKAEKSTDRPSADLNPESVAAPSSVLSSAPTPTSQPAKPENTQPSKPETAQPAKVETTQQAPASSSTSQPGRPSKRTAAKNNNIGPSKKNTSVNSAPVANAPSSEAEGSDDQRTKRKRLPTQVYQSPIPELNIIAKMSKNEKPVDKAPEDRLIVFYRNEFLAVRNEEGGYYVCQTMQNVYKSSSRIRIRWLSQQENTDYYSPDFYDNTEFDCILTNLNLERIEKNKYRLPDVESQRTQSILKRAIDVQKGVAPPEVTTVTEEHPDGLDLSLYRNEDQLKKRKRSVRNKIQKKRGRSAKQINTVKKNRDVTKRKPVVEVKKDNSTNLPLKRIGRGVVKPEKSVVQLIVESKKMGRRKAASSPVANKTTSVVPPTKEVVKKKEVSKPPPPKRKISEPPSAPVPEKKAKPGTASKTRSGVAGGPNEAQQQNARRSTRTK